jgi:hypothetical protein
MGKGKPRSAKKRVANEEHRAARQGRRGSGVEGCLAAPAAAAPLQICRKRRARESCPVPVRQGRVYGETAGAHVPEQLSAHSGAAFSAVGACSSSDDDSDGCENMRPPTRNNYDAPLARTSSLTSDSTPSGTREGRLALRRPHQGAQLDPGGVPRADPSRTCLSGSDTQSSSEAEGEFDDEVPRIDVQNTPASAACGRSFAAADKGGTKRKKRGDPDSILTDESIARILGFRCSCGRDCMSHLTRAEVFMAREATHDAMEETKLRSHVLHQVANAATMCRATERTIYQFHVANRPVCEGAWALVHAVQASLLRNAKTWHKKGLNEPEKRKRKSRSKRNSSSNQEAKLRMRSEASNTCVEWMSEYVKHHGCQMPDSQYTYIDNVPFSKLHADYAAETAAICEPVCGRQFTRLWWCDFRKTVRKRKRKPFGTCTTCMGYKTSIAKLVRDAVALRRAKQEYYAHLEEQKNERLAYYGRRMKGVMGSALSIIMDGMDQNKLILPHAKEGLKNNDGYVETKVNGVLVHGHFFDAYVVEPQVAHDSNLSITCLHRTLMKLFKAGPVPKVLYLQVDGGSENKNQWMLSYLSLLVEVGLFHKIKMCFLPVGHTHEDIDQVNPQLHCILSPHSPYL